MPSPVRFAAAIALTLACWLIAPIRAGEISNTDAELQFQLANLLFDETRYWDALQAFERAGEAADPALALRALKGIGLLLCPRGTRLRLMPVATVTCSNFRKSSRLAARPAGPHPHP